MSDRYGWAEGRPSTQQDYAHPSDTPPDEGAVEGRGPIGEFGRRVLAVLKRQPEAEARLSRECKGPVGALSVFLAFGHILEHAIDLGLLEELE